MPKKKKVNKTTDSPNKQIKIMPASKNLWNVILGIAIVAYVVLTTMIFVFQKKIEILENKAKTADESKKEASVSNVTNKNKNDLILDKKEDGVFSSKESYETKEKKLLNELESDSKNKNSQEELGKFYAQEGKLTKAIEQFEAIVKQNPEDAEVHLQLGQLYMTDKKLSQKASEHLHKFLELAPNNPQRKIVELWIKQLAK